MPIASAIVFQIVYCTACICSGAALFRLIAPRYPIRHHIAAATGISFLLGQGVLAAIWQLVASVGQFSSAVILVVLGISILVGIRVAFPLMVTFTQRCTGVLVDSVKGERLWWKLLPVLPILLIILTGFSALQPPQPRGDSLAFYMALPKLIAATQRIIPMPGFEGFTQITLQGELHFAALLALGSPITAKLFAWTTGLAVGLLLLVIGQDIGLQRRGQWITLLALYSSTAFTLILWDGKVDIFGTAMGVAAFYWALQIGADGRSEHDNAIVRLAGLFAGLAAAGKISLLTILPPSILLLIVLRGSLIHKNAITAKAWLLTTTMVAINFAVWIVLPLVPHVVKSAVVFNQPLAPFVATSPGYYLTGLVYFSPETTTRIVLTYPFSLVFGNFWAQGGTLSPIGLAFAPLVLVLLSPRNLTAVLSNKLVQVSGASLFALLIWVVIRPSMIAPRYIMPPLLLLLLVGAYGAQRVLHIASGANSLRAGVVFSMLLTWYTVTPTLLSLATQGFQYATGQVSECAFEAPYSDGSCRIAAIVNERAIQAERVFLGADYRYWLRPDLVQCGQSSTEYAAIMGEDSPEMRWTLLYEHDFRYLIIDNLTHADVATNLDLSHVPAWLDVVPLFKETYFSAYRVTARDHSHPVQWSCRQTSPLTWQVVGP